MSKKIKSITNPHLSLNILSAEDVQKIHNASLSIIENVGIRFPIRTRTGYLGSTWSKDRPEHIHRQSSRADHRRSIKRGSTYLYTGSPRSVARSTPGW